MSTTRDEHGPEEVATVHYLDSRRTDSIDPQTEAGEQTEVLEAELVDEEEYRRLTDPKLAALDRYAGYKNDLARAGRGVRTVATHQRTKTSALFAARHGFYLTAGAWDMVCESYKRGTHRDIDESIRAAQRDGDHSTAAHLQHQKIESRKLFLERIQVFGKFAVRAPLGAGVLTGATLVITFVLSVVGLFQHGPDGFTSTWSTFGNALVAGWDWLSWIGTTLLPAAALVGLAGVLLTGYNQRRRAGNAPSWAQAGMSLPTQAVPIDETAIAQALGALGLTPISQHLKQGLPLQYTVMPHRAKNEDGEKDVGVSAQVRLPGGTAAEEVIKRSKKLSAALARASVEVWPSVGGDEGLLELWIADRGSLDGSAPPWPWLERTEAIDLYQGVPVGRTLDGRTIVAPIDGASYLVGGQPGQGKSQFVRTLVCGAMFDPRARIRAHVLASNNDFAPMRKRLEKYVTGLGQETIQAVLDEMVELYEELTRRGEYMEAHGYDTASQAGFEPIVSVFDEIHQAFQCRDKQLREQIASYAEDLAKLARKYGILVIYSTQSADAQSIPKGVTRQSQQRIAYSVVDQPANDGLLGSGSYRQGVTATSLRPGNKSYHGDRGKSVTVGLVPDANWAMCCGFYLDSDIMPGLVERALAVQSQAQTPAWQLANQPQYRDLLEDLDAVLGTDRANAADVPALLRDLDPSAQRYYAELTGKDLVERLASYGLKCPNVSRKHKVIPDAVRGKLAEQRATADGDDTDEDTDPSPGE